MRVSWSIGAGEDGGMMVCTVVLEVCTVVGERFFSMWRGETDAHMQSDRY